MAGKAVTLLVGGPASMVLVTVGVSSGALVSKTTAAWALIVVPVARSAFGWTVYWTKRLAAAGAVVGGQEAGDGVRRQCRWPGRSRGTSR